MAEASTMSWLPQWAAESELLLERFDVTHPREAGEILQCVRPTSSAWTHLAAGLIRAQRALAALPIASITAAIDEVATSWVDRSFPLRRSAVEAVVRATGFSPEAVERSFDVELRNYRADSLRRTLTRELGDPAILDSFVPDQLLGGHTYAIGPKITLAVLTGNVPGLPALPIVRALLLKSAVIAKVASGEPTFAAYFARSLHDVLPVLSDALVVTYWQREELDVLDAALGVSDAVIAFGSDEACATVRARLRPAQRYVEHGHKLSLGLISLDYLRKMGIEEVARRVADDVSTFNQHACIAPQAYLVEDHNGTARELAGAIAKALSHYAERCPLGELDEPDAGALQLRRAAAAWEAATASSAELWRASNLDWTVQLTEQLLPLSGAGNRDLRVVPCTDLLDATKQLAPLGRHLQNVGLGALGAEFFDTAAALARIGACRITEPGQMAEPSLIWRHDGELCLAQLVRFCDIEMHRFSVHSD
jgi:hypothetical protein